MFGRPLVVMEPTVLTGRMSQTQLRCVTKADCAKVGAVAQLLESMLEGPIAIGDLSARYDGRSGTRPFHYEILFRPGEIRLRPNAARAASTGQAASLPREGDVPPSPTPANLRDGRMQLDAPVLIRPGDLITLRLFDVTNVARRYVVTVDGRDAPYQFLSNGIQIIVPDLPRDLLTRRTVPLRVKVAGVPGFTASHQLRVASWAEDRLPWLAAALAAAALAAFFIFRLRRAWGAREYYASDTGSSGFDAYWGGRETRDYLKGDGAPRLPVPEPPDGLVEACALGASILFLGGEVPSFSGYPSHVEALARILETWPNLPPELRADGRKLIAGGDLDTVMDLLAVRLGRGTLVEALERQYSASTPGKELASSLSRLPFLGVITSTLGPLPEAIWPQHQLLTPRSDQDFSGLLRSGQPFLLRMRGLLGGSTPINLTSVELARALDEAPQLRSTLNAMFSSRTLLFVGVDASTLTSVLDLAGIRMASGQQHYALVRDSQGFEISADRFRRHYGIEFLRVDGPRSIEAFLASLADRVTRFTSDGAIDEQKEAASLERARISRLVLHNIGPFSDLSVDFRKPWTILLGNNGAGKSTILRAIAVALCGDDASILDHARPLLRRGKQSGLIELHLGTGATSVVLRSQLSLVQGRLHIKAGTAPLQSGTLAVFGFPAVRGAIPPGSVDLTREDDFPHPRVSDVLPIITGAADERGRGLRQWIFRTYAQSQDSNLRAAAQARSRAKVDSLFRLIDSMVPGFKMSFSRCDLERMEILLKTSDGEVPLDYISQGMSATIGWVGPMIQRLYELSGDNSEPEQQHAILLIDEIDSHLHPEWQQRLVGSLKQHFPNVQVIATTHSPLMVGNLEANEVMRVVRTPAGLEVDYLAQSFIGYRFDQILTDAAFGLKRARSEHWTAREDYAALAGKSNLTPEERAELARLTEELRRLPGPGETPAEWRAAAQGEETLAAALQMARDAPKPLNAGPSGRSAL